MIDLNCEKVSWKELCEDQFFIDVFLVYEMQNPTGGSLHIVLADFNNSDHSIEFCFNYAKENNDYVGMYLASKLFTVKVEDRDRYNWEILNYC